jgi:hypothetical protein
VLYHQQASTAKKDAPAPHHVRHAHGLGSAIERGTPISFIKTSQEVYRKITQ